MIWRAGVLPIGSPAFSPSLTADLLDQGYGLLGLSLRARTLGAEGGEVDRALALAAESIESAVRKGPTDDVERGFHLVVSAAAFHLAQYAARAYCLLPRDSSELNESTVERALVALVRSSRRDLRRLCLTWLGNPAYSDDALSNQLRSIESEVRLADVEVIAITSALLRGLALFDAALATGNERTLEEARRILGLASRASADGHYVSLWWTSELAAHLVDGIWERTLHRVVPDTAAEDESWNDLRAKYIALLAERVTSEIELWPSQLEAARRSVDLTDDLVVALPTSSGKTRIAELCILRCLASGKRAVYVTPLRALSAQVERGLSRMFAPLGFSVTALYGASGVAVADIGTLESASIVVATPEKLDFALRQQPSVIDDVGLIVLDEGHMIGLGEREIRYEVLVQRLLRRPDEATRRLVCLSAVFTTGTAFDDFTQWLRSDAPGDPVTSEWRPTRQRSATLTWEAPNALLRLAVDGESPYVPAFFRERPATGRRKKAFPQNDEEFVLASANAFLGDNQRVLIYCPQRGSVEHLGDSYLKLHRQGYLPDFLPDGIDIARAVAVGKEWLGENHVAVKCLSLGVAIHHGALPRAFLGEIETLLSERKIRFTIASPTLAQGIDLSCSVLIFRSIYRAGKVIKAEEYANVIGRAGRAFVDLDGITVFPAFGTGFERRRRINDYRRLQSNANNRVLESGIVLLVEGLIEVLAKHSGTSFDDAVAYMTNTRGPWSVSELRGARTVAVEAEEGFDSESYVAAALADLDTTVLSTIEDVAIDVTRVAEAIDAALVGSLWSRRLMRREPELAVLNRSVIVARAHWLWSNSTPTQRLGYYAAGIGHASGSYLSRRLPELVEHLKAAETALFAREIEIAAIAIVNFSEILFGTAPFTPKRALPPRWRDILHQWIAGLEMPPVLSDPAADIDFLQDGIVYRLVWGVEAVRVQAIAEQLISVEDLSGNVALSLTYGLPSVPAVLLAQAGLPSRSMVGRLLSEFEAAFSDLAGMREWISENAAAALGLWATNAESLLWQDFLERWQSGTRASWIYTSKDVEVVWEQLPPPVGTPVRVIHDAQAGETAVYRLDLTRLGALAAALPEVEIGVTYAAVTDDAQRIALVQLGPA